MIGFWGRGDLRVLFGLLVWEVGAELAAWGQQRRWSCFGYVTASIVNSTRYCISHLQFYYILIYTHYQGSNAGRSVYTACPSPCLARPPRLHACPQATEVAAWLADGEDEFARAFAIVSDRGIGDTGSSLQKH